MYVNAINITQSLIISSGSALVLILDIHFLSVPIISSGLSGFILDFHDVFLWMTLLCERQERSLVRYLWLALFCRCLDPHWVRL